MRQDINIKLELQGGSEYSRNDMLVRANPQTSAQKTRLITDPHFAPGKQPAARNIPEQSFHLASLVSTLASSGALFALLIQYLSAAQEQDFLIVHWKDELAQV